MKIKCSRYFSEMNFPSCLAPSIGANYSTSGVLVVTPYCFLPEGADEVDADKFYAGDYPLKETVRSAMDNSTPAGEQDSFILKTPFREDVALYHFVLRPMKSRIDTKKEVKEVDLEFAVKALLKMILFCEPTTVCFCGYSLLRMVEAAFLEYSTINFAEFARRMPFSYTFIAEPVLFGLDNDMSSRGWFTNLLLENGDLHGKSKYKLISQAFDKAVENDDYTGLLNVISEFQKEISYKAEPEDVAIVEKTTSEDRIKLNIEARRKRSEKLQNTAKNYWNQYFDRSRDLFEGTPVKVWPYIGNEYFSSDVKILSLGESHYKKARSDGSKPDLNSDSTIDVFLGSYQWNGWEFRNGSFAESIKYTAIPPYCRCYRKVASMISGAKSGDADFVNDHIAFMNYFQCVVGDKPRENFEDNGWVKEEDERIADKSLFDGALPILLPDIVIVWGHRLFRYIQKVGRSLTPVENGNDNLLKYTLELSDGTKKEILFLVTPHPSSYGKGGWDNDGTQNLWSLVTTRFPQIESICKHHPALPNVKELYKKMRAKYKGLFVHVFSESSYGMWLFPFENGVANGKSPRCMFAELVMSENMETSIHFNSRDFNEETCRKILEHPTWGISAEALDSCTDGKFTLATFPAGTPLGTLEAEMTKVAEKMQNYRQAVAW